ncbi:MAG: histidinol dehydrogenase [Prochlorococcus sp. SP3034]|nr:histidinol dehydrogenase [Prochlorococcus sp. SP3034]|tara:strand:- start:2311 stop:3597 length:1287 start_codon:yes stop_codon:yes gene_type:complete
MKIIDNKNESTKELKRIAERTSLDNNDKINILVKTILKDIKDNGDEALKQYTLKFDGFDPTPSLVDQAEIKQAWDNTDINLQKALINAKERIENFHIKQIPESFSIEGIFGDSVQRRWLPVNKAGLYIPGGRAAYPSTVLMNAIPANVAGVKEISMVSPANNKGKINRTVLAAAYLTGIKNVYRVGGAQAIGALAYGTQTINKVDVISGPGNIYVTTAKKLIYGSTGIDSLAGPSEILIIADETANASQLATDLLAQAEHDPFASAILLTTSSKQALKVSDEVDKKLKTHPRGEICSKSIKDWGLISVCEDLDTCIKLSNQFAPEHLEIIINHPSQIVNKIENAGAIFLGKWTPEAVGDYLAGPNHTLPTSGNARFSGSLGVETFMKNSSIIKFTEKSLYKNKDDIINLANSEGLYSHADSVKIRFDN